jgi:serine/threonine protein phosphatase Stp1
MSNFRWTSVAVTHVGNVRSVNEDSILEMPRAGVWVVADGMGGYQAGDVASQLIVDRIKQLDAESNLEAAVEYVQCQLHESNRQLVDYANQINSGDPVGSTVVALLVRGATVAFLWVGDSRIYRLRNGSMQQMTRDHSAVEEWVAKGLLSRSEAENHPSANIITRAVGSPDELEIDSAYEPLQNEDMYLLCSDGLNKELSDAEIMAIMNKGDVTEICETLVGTTLQRQGRDNISVIIVKFSEIF